MTFFGGAFLVGFIKMLGGSDVWIGVLTAIPSILGLLQIPGAIWGRSHGTYKRFVTPGGLLWRVLHLPIVALPVLALSSDAKLVILAVCLSLAYLCVHIVNPIYQDWLAEMIPANSRGWFFGRRTAVFAAYGAVVGMAGGVALDAFRAAKNEPAGYMTLFGFGAVCGILSMVFYLQMTDRRREVVAKVNLRESFRAVITPVQDRKFRVVLLFLIFAVLGQQFAGNLFAAFALESLGLNFTLLQCNAVAYAVGSIFGARIWGFLADKYGNKPIMAILCVGLSVTPACWLFCVPGQDLRNALVLIPGHVVSGFFWGGVNVCQFNLLLATADDRQRANFIAAGMAIQSIMGALAPFAGSVLMQWLRISLPAFAAYQWLFIVTMISRLLAIFFLLPVKEPGSTSIRAALKQLRRVTPSGYRALRELSTSPDEDIRASAMQSVARQHFDVAADELIKALHDPSPRLRRQAARALAELGDSRAAEALLHQLEEHPDLVEEETIEALGRLAGGEAVEELTRYLKSPRSQIRRAAARALGRIGSEDVAGPLVEAASSSGDPDLRRAALQAIRDLESPAVEAVIADALSDSHPSVRIAAAEAVVSRLPQNVRDRLKQALELYDDEAACEIAYALGCVGKPEDLPAILMAAAKSQSIITRRRCLLAAAKLFGVEEGTYRLLLLEGMTRDTKLLELLSGARKRSKSLRDALEEYSLGHESAANRRIAQTRRGANLLPFADQPVEESFLVAALAYSRQLDL